MFTACFFLNIIVMFGACLVQKEMVKMGYFQESVHKQEVLESKNT